MAKKITLPSGKTATMAQGKGYHLLNAQRTAKDSDSIPYALLAELCEIEGKKVVYEDILEMDLDDVSALLTEFNQKEGKSMTPKQSSSSV